MRYVFDLDGTLADDSHRKRVLKAPDPDWATYHSLCEHDTPIQPLVAILVDAVHSCRHDIEIWTARSEDVRDQTVRWLHEHARRVSIREEPHPRYFHEDPVVDLRMRAHGDNAPDTEIKRIWLREGRAQGREPHLVFDDRRRVVDMWRAEGIRCCQVAPGEF